VDQTQVVYSHPIPFHGIWRATFRILCGCNDKFHNLIGIASSPSLINDWLGTTHYVGWCFNSRDPNYTVKGILSGEINNKNRNIFTNKISGVTYLYNPSQVPHLADPLDFPMNALGFRTSHLPLRRRFLVF